MSVIVIGTGRSGTNVHLEILRGSEQLHATTHIENKAFGRNPTIYPDNYLSKCDTHYLTCESLLETMSLNKQMRIVWTVRNPRDMIMSKLRRGVPFSEGGDCRGVADDATINGCMADLGHMMSIYETIIWTRLKYVQVRLEDTLSHVERAVGDLCFALNMLTPSINIRYDLPMCNFPSRMRNPFKRSRYPTLDKNQIDLNKNWETWEDGFLVKKRFPIPDMFREVDYICKEFGYEVYDESIQHS